MQKNSKIVVLGGGLSTERQVSLVTSTSVCHALRKSGYRAIFVDLFLGIEDYDGPLEALFDREDGLCGNVAVARIAPDISDVIRSRKLKSASKIGTNVLEICKKADCVFLGLHGEDGEDGKIQAALDMLGIPYTGSGPLGSSMAMDKRIARLIMEASGIRCAPLAEHAPCVLKCAHGGSSIGTYVCDTEEELKAALEDVRQYEDEYLIEQKIVGTELTVPVLNGKALCPIEIVPPSSGKFDYIAKYQSGKEGATEICPARLSEEKTKEVQAIAEHFHQAMKLDVYSRSDFIMDKDGVFWCLEVNTLPGMTPSSLIPKAAKQAGLSYEGLCEKILQLSMEVKR